MNPADPHLPGKGTWRKKPSESSWISPQLWAALLEAASSQVRHGLAVFSKSPRPILAGAGEKGEQTKCSAGEKVRGLHGAQQPCHLQSFTSAIPSLTQPPHPLPAPHSADNQPNAKRKAWAQTAQLSASFTSTCDAGCPSQLSQSVIPSFLPTSVSRLLPTDCKHTQEPFSTNYSLLLEPVPPALNPSTSF